MTGACYPRGASPMDLARVLTSLILAAACRPGAAERPPPDHPTPGPPSISAEAPPATPGEPHLGTEHPFVFVAADPDARWTALCQARADTDGDAAIRVQAGQHGDTYGDRLDTSLILGAGPGEAIDDLVAVDERGDHLLLIQGGRLIHLHLPTSRREPVADALVDARRAGALDRAGRRLAYRRGGARELVVVRDLQSGAEVVVDPGRGLLHDFAFVGEWLELVVIPRDTDGDRKLQAARTFPSLSRRACPGPIDSYEAFSAPGDRAERRYVPATGGAPTLIPDVIAPLGALLLARAPGGALVAHGLDGQRDPWVPAACEGQVLALAPEGPRALVACTGRGQQARVAIYGPGLEHGLAGRAVLDPFSSSIPVGRLAFYTTSQGLRIVDLTALTERSLPPGHTFVAASEERVLLTATDPSRALSIFEYGSGAQRVLAPDTLPSDTLRQGPLVAVRPVLVDLERGALVGRFDGPPLALARDGRVLLPQRPPRGDASPELPLGPLVWRTPRPE